jgi:hypothetical protein
VTTFADILGASRKVVAEGGLELFYRPAVVTPALLARVLAMDKAEPLEQLQVYRDLIPLVIESWDLVNEEDPVPLTAEGIDSVPLAILDIAFSAVMDDREARASEEGKGSDASTDARPSASMTQSSTESHQNGTDSSKPLASITSVPGNS